MASLEPNISMLMLWLRKLNGISFAASSDSASRNLHGLFGKNVFFSQSW